MGEEEFEALAVEDPAQGHTFAQVVRVESTKETGQPKPTIAILTRGSFPTVQHEIKVHRQGSSSQALPRRLQVDPKRSSSGLVGQRGLLGP